MINIISYNRVTKVLVYEENGERNEVEYFRYMNSLKQDEEIYDLISFTFHALLMLEISLYDSSILRFTYKCFSDNNDERDFDNYEQFVEEMCKQIEVSDDEKSILKQTIELEKTAKWNME